MIVRLTQAPHIEPVDRTRIRFPSGTDPLHSASNRRLDKQRQPHPRCPTPHSLCRVWLACPPCPWLEKARFPKIMSRATATFARGLSHYCFHNCGRFCCVRALVRMLAFVISSELSSSPHFFRSPPPCQQPLLPLPCRSLPRPRSVLLVHSSTPSSAS